MEWLTIEVFDGPAPAVSWRTGYGDALIGSAVSLGAVYWEWHEHRWGVVLELLFRDEVDVRAFRDVPVVRAALDAAPDPVNGVLVYRGRGGGSGAAVPRRPRPAPVAGAVALPEPVPDDVTPAEPWPGRGEVLLIAS